MQTIFDASPARNAQGLIHLEINHDCLLEVLPSGNSIPALFRKGASFIKMPFKYKQMFARSHLLHVQPTPSLCAFHAGHEKRPEHSGLSRFRPAQTKPGPTVQQGESHFPNATGERYFLSKEKEFQ
ncbi:hypothetical protein [Bilophila wadsworthia]|uniref:hypothetical protein n=1 Tax=Bilophila wadsworthia TaxID=35833 RepID=UPI0027B9996F|nr:hypothetical protein [Bilophila wadsworthia]MDU4374860.1 hypothetical protein [Bilophila wadsworthia]